MSIKHKLTAILLAFSVLILGVLVVNFYLSYASNRLYLDNQDHQLRVSASNALDVSNELLYAMVNDNTFWTDMKEFTVSRDSVFAATELEQIAHYKYLDYLWIYNLSATNIFSSQNDGNLPIANPIPPNRIPSILDTVVHSKKLFTKFYLRRDTNIIVSVGASIHGSDDAARVQKPSGFLFVGQILDSVYLAQLKKLTSANVRILTDSILDESQVNDKIYFLKNFTDYNNQYLFSLYFEKTDSYIQENTNNQRSVIGLVFIIALIAIVIVLFIFREIFFKPFNALIVSLDTDSQTPIKPYLGQQNEIGQMADLIAFTYEQRWKLKQEVEERTVLMEELSEKNEELLLQEAKTQALFTDVTLANQVLIQQNEEIRALNDDILEKSQAITSQLAALKASDLLLLKLKTSVEQSESIVVITDNGGVIEYVNQAFTHVTGFIPAEVVGKSTRILQSGYHDKAFYRQMWTTIRSGATWKGEFFNRRKNGETFWETSIITPIKNEANEIVSYIAIKEDITDARDAQNKLARFNKIIASSHKQITASIDYAKRIQGAVLPKLNALSPFFSEHFVLFKPRDTVSGDFHFVQAHKNFIFIAAVDCTGHGVPGAFMSMMGITFLHEIVSQPDGVSAAQALDLLRQKLKQALYQDGESREQHDSMDIAFACIDTQTKILSFAGAYNSLLIFREGVMHKLQADRMPIGVHRKEKPFTNHEFQLQTDDVLYFFTDGYYSQFNHQTKDKMLAKNFINLLQEIHKNTLDQQHTLLTNYLQQWQGTEPQVDDILVIGLRL